MTASKGAWIGSFAVSIMALDRAVRLALTLSTDHARPGVFRSTKISAPPTGP